jgi:hypothetical protein
MRRRSVLSALSCRGAERCSARQEIHPKIDKDGCVIQPINPTQADRLFAGPTRRCQLDTRVVPRPERHLSAPLQFELGENIVNM